MTGQGRRRQRSLSLPSSVDELNVKKQWGIEELNLLRKELNGGGVRWGEVRGGNGSVEGNVVEINGGGVMECVVEMVVLYRDGVWVETRGGGTVMRSVLEMVIQ